VSEKTNRQPRLPILTYHSIDNNGSAISVSPEKFRSQVRQLKEMSFEVISLSQAVACLFQGEALPARSLVMTFDDGFKSVYHEAYPVLREMGLPATVFLVPEYCGRSNQWPGQPRRIPASELLDWKEIKEMSEHGIDFGAHTLTHRDLSQLPFDEAVREIRESKLILENRLGRPVRFFAYPYGKGTAAIRSIVGREFAAACSTELGFVTPQSDAFFLPRIDMYYFSRNCLLAKLDTPLVGLYLRFRGLVRSVLSRT
jgi:peptidoglycan/xylan/chitin deacetylase (PgdA/CDA1 family)